ncbi:monovalent cation/H+ antiporter subunit E [Corynebacterium timonense]|uniref:Multisubunit sodium/proton antiporter, MrpE subunit n=1 Tax=Corynebacterium timonense TaxID=441500 RepID=A0A1H1TNI0_9CORY|nr:monovalent cation/H+ antiporter subunit E [Corynebacterium timonense]SDS61516.1 multisubunit sodium/proton antiporter, MrpE subunit [Corynebacterium timonense]
MALKRIGHALGYGAWLIKEIFSAGTAASIAAFRPHSGLHPIIIFYPLRVTSDWERFWLSTSITATPGTMSIGFRRGSGGSEQTYLLVQAAFGEDPTAQIEGLIDMEQRLSPHVAATPLDPASVEWTPYTDRGPRRDVPPAERLD